VSCSAQPWALPQAQTVRDWRCSWHQTDSGRSHHGPLRPRGSTVAPRPSRCRPLSSALPVRNGSYASSSLESHSYRRNSTCYRQRSEVRGTEPSCDERERTAAVRNLRGQLTDAAAGAGDAAAARYRAATTRVGDAVDDRQQKGRGVYGKALSAVVRGAEDVNERATEAQIELIKAPQTWSAARRQGLEIVRTHIARSHAALGSG
jgi:hypothetical protein